MSKLLQCLDNAVAMDPVALEQSVIDKAYMAQLIEVQHLRGARGGDKFYSMLTDGGSLQASQGTDFSRSVQYRQKSYHLYVYHLYVFSLYFLVCPWSD